MKADPDLHWKALLRHYQPAKPLIAAVEGYAVAGGTEILQGTDIRVAGEGAKFGVFEARRGLFPLGGSTVRLRRQIPFTVAMDLLLTAREVDAAGGPRDRPHRPGGARRARRWTRRLGIAEVITANGPLAVEAIKRSVRETEGMSEEDGLASGARDRLAHLRHRGRQGRRQGLRREAPGRLQAALAERSGDTWLAPSRGPVTLCHAEPGPIHGRSAHQPSDRPLPPSQ